MILVDDAHATGIFGPHGAGLIAAHNLTGRVNLSMGTLSKGLGGFGGFITCSEPMKDWLINAARSVIYTTALPPAVCAAGTAALALLKQEPERGPELLRRAARFRDTLRASGFDTGPSTSMIIPLKIGANAAALALAERVRAQGVIAVAIRPPTVPPGTARLRLSVTLAHTRDDLDHAAHLLATAARELGLLP
jgi:8-amino-7-oxononanoate synthase